MKHAEQVLNIIKYMHKPVGAEIGVMKGQFSEYLLSNKTDLKLFCIDPFVVYEEHYILGHPSRQHAFPEQHHWDAIFNDTKNKLKKFNDRATIIREPSMVGVKNFPDEFFDFVFIDANHIYEYVKEDILAWSPKVKRDGLIIGHDYNLEKEEFSKNVCRAVHELFPKEIINLGSGMVWWVEKAKV